MHTYKVKNILDQINDALKNKIVYWKDGENLSCGVIVKINPGGAVVDKRLLPESLKPIPMDRNPIKILGLEKLMLGIYEPISLS